MTNLLNPLNLLNLFVCSRAPLKRRFVSGGAKGPPQGLRRPTKSRQGAKPFRETTYLPLCLIVQVRVKPRLVTLMVAMRALVDVFAAMS